MVHFLLLKCDHHTLENKLTAEVGKNILEIQSN
jgi:hypothetical protein